MVTRRVAHGVFTKLKTRELTLALGGESESFCTWRNRCVQVVRVRSMVYGVDDGEICIVITHMPCVSICVVHWSTRAGSHLGGGIQQQV